MPRLRPPSEATEQRELVRWKTLMQPQEPRLRMLFHIPNGEKRPPRTAAKLAQMGVLPGVADFFLSVPRFSQDGCVCSHGAYIELKRLQGGEVSADQEQWLTLARDYGYHAYIARGWVDAAYSLCWYLDRPDLVSMFQEGASQ